VVDARARLASGWVGRVVDQSRRHPLATDALVALIIGVFGVLLQQDVAAYNQLAVKNGTASADEAAAATLTALTIAAAVAAGVPFAFRRKAPLIAGCLCLVFGILGATTGVLGFDLVVIVGWFAIHGIAAFTEGRTHVWGRRLIWLTVTGALTAAVVAYTQDDLYAGARIGSQLRTLIIAIVLIAAYIGTAWVSGAFSRMRDERVRLLAQQAQDLELQQANRERQAVLDERVRIAREVHDVVAHHVSVMGVQAGAARRILDKQPERVSGVLNAIENSSRAAVTELSRLVWFLRGTTGTSDGRTTVDLPQPTLEQLSGLFSEARSVGMDLHVEEQGERRELPASVGLCAYRIVQEALTNVRRHAGVSAPTTVEVSYRLDGVELMIRNRGQVASTMTSPTNEGGHGLIGMRERVLLVGGTLSAGAIPGGYEVRAWLPASTSATSSAGQPITQDSADTHGPTVEPSDRDAAPRSTDSETASHREQNVHV
jgi:signal transduction histidine kinase